jgi:site-specific recombinase XerD
MGATSRQEFLRSIAPCWRSGGKCKEKRPRPVYQHQPGPRAGGLLVPSPLGGHLDSDTITTHFSALFRPLGIDGSIHRLRHVYGTRPLRAGANIRVVQKLMSHSSIQSTMGYTAVGEDELWAGINLLRSTEGPPQI